MHFFCKYFLPLLQVPVFSLIKESKLSIRERYTVDILGFQIDNYLKPNLHQGSLLIY